MRQWIEIKCLHVVAQGRNNMVTLEGNYLPCKDDSEACFTVTHKVKQLSDKLQQIAHQAAAKMTHTASHLP